MLQTGARLGSYEIRGPLGAGGMGEVYRAWDARLGREVAIKVLPQSAAHDPDRLRRFEAEARAAGALNHPNVLVVYDVGSHESGPFIVSELLQGDTLRGQIRGGGLTPRKAVEYAIQIARGLAAAHQRGIVHRDLKPENVFVTRDGHVKILDFGLAKLREESRGDPEGATETRETRPGVVLGTLPYLSPEQVRGLPADARSDIFALGAVLYEMLARRRAFVGETASEIETAILREEPRELPVSDGRVPGALDRITRRCLEKRPEDRFESARDVAFALDAVATGASPAAGNEPRGPRRALPLAAVLLLGLAAGAGLLAALRRPASPPSYTQLTFRRGAVLSARFAPDGQTVVYSAAWDGQPAQVYTTRIGSRESRPLGLEGTVLSVSSQGEVAVKRGRFLGRFSAGRGEPGTLARVSLAGGAPRDLLDDVRAADWDPEGRDLAVVHNGSLEYPIGHVVYAPEESLHSVRILPDGRFAILEDQPKDREEAPWRFRISLVDRAGHASIVSSEWWYWWDLSWSKATQELFFVASQQDDQALRAVSLGGRERTLARLPVDLAVLDVDPQGRLLIERRLRRTSVVAFLPGESRGRDLSLLDTTEVADLSADGRLLVLNEDGPSPGTDVTYLRKTDGSPAVRLGDEMGLALSPDGRFVLAFPGYQSVRDHLVLVPTGAGERRELRHPSIREFKETAGWFPDGRRIAFVGAETGQQKTRLFAWDIESGAPPRPLSPEGGDGGPVSPDGRWVAGHAADGGFVLYAVDGSPARRLSGGAASDLLIRWSADGRWIYARRDHVSRRSEGQAWIDRIEVATGKRIPWKLLAPADPAGVHSIGLVQITPDGRGYAYAIRASIGSLYLAEGLR
jgi:hypothetical protein